MIASWEENPVDEFSAYSLGINCDWKVAKVFSFASDAENEPITIELAYLYRRLKPRPEQWDMLQYVPCNVPSLEVSTAGDQVLRIALNLDKSVYPKLGKILSLYRMSDEHHSIREFTAWHTHKISEFFPTDQNTGFSSVLLVDHMQLISSPVVSGLKVA
jgi:hypothetical protein